jgi:hypothetical protein
MNLNLRSFIICLLCLAHPVLVFSASELTFNSSARPATLVLGDVDFLAADSSAGFNLRYSNGKDVADTRLSKISTKKKKRKQYRAELALSLGTASPQRDTRQCGPLQ